MRPCLLILTLLGLCLPVVGEAQLRFGVAGELNRTSLGGVPPDHATLASNFGTGFAAVVDWRVHPDVVLSFQPGWAQRGAKVVFNESENPDSAQTFAIEQAWARFPVLFRIDSEGQGFYAGGGLSLDVLLQSELENAGTKVDNKDTFDDVDLAFLFNAGYMTDHRPRSIFFEARYMQGLTTIADRTRATTEGAYVSDYKSTGFSLVVGLLF